MANGYKIMNAFIESAEITRGEIGFLDLWVTLNYGGSCQGFGGYVLYLPKSFDHHKLESVAGHHIFRIMEIAGVDSWNKLRGKTVRANASSTHVKAIGHIVNDDWFCPEDDYCANQILNQK